MSAFDRNFLSGKHHCTILDRMERIAVEKNEIIFRPLQTPEGVPEFRKINFFDYDQMAIGHCRAWDANHRYVVKIQNRL
jgi:hypothetical protein